MKLLVMGKVLSVRELLPAKLLLIMKLTAAILLFVVLHVSAHSFSQNITISGKNMEWSQVIHSIKKQTGYSFVYDENLLSPSFSITLNYKNAPLKEVLDMCFKDQPLSYRIVNKVIVVSPERRSAITDPPIAPPVVIKGKVTNEKGEPLGDVSVHVKGADKSVITNSRGEYTLNSEQSPAVIIFSHIGYATREVPVSGRTAIDVQLAESYNKLNDMVVVGYGSIRKSDLTGSVSKVIAENVNERPISTVEQMLQGHTPGVQIIQNTGAPGGGITFNIRGTNSISGSNQPLIVIDGYPVESDNQAVKMDVGSQSDYLADQPTDNALASLNPADIASIEILKDASSTAIYGSRGANGVVLITTKRGKSGKDRIEYNYRGDLSNIPKEIDLLNTRDYINYANEGYLNSAKDSLYKQDAISNFLKTDINWQDLIFRTAVNQSHQVNISGGNDKMKYSAVLGYLGQQSVVENSYFDRGSIRLNLDREVSQRFKFGISISGTMSKNKAAMQSSSLDDISTSIILGALRSRPLVSPYTADDELDESYIGNPLTLVTLAEDINRVTTILTNITAEYKILPDLTFKVNGGVNNIESTRDFYHPHGTALGNISGGYAYKGNSGSFNYLTEYTLNYNRVFNKHRINAVGGYTWQEWKRNTFGINALGFPNDNQSYYNLGAASSVSKPVTNTTQWALASFLGRVNYSYNDKYLLTFTGRSDGSTRLAKGNKWAFFPSAAVGWNLRNEEFMKGLHVISDLKIRASYGLSGNQAIAVGATRGSLQTVSSVINQTIQTGYVQASIPNSNLHWETTAQTDLGLDLSLFNNRISFVFDYYHKKTKDLLISLVIPPSNSYNSYNTNSGVIQNNGYEFELDGKILTGNLKWDASANLSVNRNKIISLGSIQSFPAPTYGAVGGQSLNIAQAGFPIGAFYGYRIIGVYQTQEEITSSPKDPVTPVPGSFKFKDINGDGKISADDREIIGNPRPDFIFGFNNNLSWKNFSLSAFIMGSIGQDVINANRYFLDALSMNFQSNVSQVAYDNRWTGPGTSNKYPRANASAQAFNSRFADFIVEDASFIRIKNIILSYTFPRKLIPVIQSLKVFASATNLFTITDYTGFDPEVNSRGQNSLTIGIDGGSIPQYRTFSFGLGVSF